MKIEHKLADEGVVRNKNGLVARCVCGWATGGHRTTLAASLAFREHLARATENTDPIPTMPTPEKAPDADGPSPAGEPS